MMVKNIGGSYNKATASSLLPQKGAKILDASGNTVKDIEFDESMDFKTLSIVNKTAKSKLYSKSILNPKHTQMWNLVYKSVNQSQLFQHSFVGHEPDDRKEEQEVGCIMRLTFRRTSL